MNPDSPTLGTLLRHLIELLDGDLEAVYRDAGLVDYRPRYTPVVRALLDIGPSPIRDVARRVGITHSAASQTVAQMVQNELLALQPGADARERVVHMTPKLRRMLRRLEQQWAATNVAAARLDEELTHSLRDAVTGAIGALERKPFRERIADAGKRTGRHGRHATATAARTRRA
ncbi:MAG: MarR family winged helix-turn-helix transcriptional regulator [Woeseiaceae bacterium]